MNNFDEKFYMATLQTADAAGLVMIPKYRDSQLMAIVYVWGVWGGKCLFSDRFFFPSSDGHSNTITGVQKDNLLSIEHE